MRHSPSAPTSAPRPLATRGARVAPTLLWVVQGLLAALFLFGGGMKLVLPVEALTAQSPLPGAFLRLVGLLEVLGALGLVLPGLFRVRLELTPLAAGGLVLLMCGAVGTTLAAPTSAGTPAMALIPAAAGALAAVVAYGRSRPFWSAAAGTVAAPTSTPAVERPLGPALRVAARSA